ncbi:MAG: glucosaminidase domain-containing protein [Eubacterium sp.]|nr:glucosaminidase domain-containing protein [Eubacterium sp.]
MKTLRKIFPHILVLALVLGMTYVEPARLEAADYYYKGEKLTFSSGTLKKYKGKVCYAISEETASQLPGVTAEYAGQGPCIEVRNQNHYMVIFGGDQVAYVDGGKKKLSILPKNVPNGDKSYMLVPLEDLLSGLKIKYKWNSRKTVCTLKKRKYDVSGKTTYTTYPYTFNSYAKKEAKRNTLYKLKDYKKALKISEDTTEGFKYLCLDTYRKVKKKKFIGFYNNRIEIYCRINKMEPTESSLYGKENAKALLAAAKKYKIDPVYFASQTFLESAYGTTVLAKGKKVGKKKKKKKVYNLYGIKAYDRNPEKYGFAYAKKKGWTTIPKALAGAAEYVAKNYIHSKYKQNTLFKYRYIPSTQLWHQYASDPFYAEKIGQKFQIMSCVYQKNVKFRYDYPKWK